MPEIKEKHPSWFKMRIEHRELVRQLSPETAVNVLLACWDFLETGEKPAGLSPIENVAFSSFMPDMDEAWSKYIKRVSSGAKGGRPKKPYGSICPHTGPYGTEVEEEVEVEVEVEEESLLSNDNRERGADKPPTPSLPKTDFGPKLAAAFEDWLEYKREKKQAYRPKGLQSLVAQIKKQAGVYGENAVADLIVECMSNGWQGIIWDRLEKQQSRQRRENGGTKGGNPFLDMLEGKK